MNDKQQLLIDCISLLPVIGILVLITVANDQLVTMVAAYVLCGELLCVLVSRILNLYYIDVAFILMCAAFGCNQYEVDDDLSVME